MKCYWLIFLLTAISVLAGCDLDDGDESVVSLASGNLIPGISHGDDGSAWGLSDCAACHPLSVIHRHADRVRDIVRDKGYDSCTGCHGSNGTQQSRRCMLCHNGGDLPAHPPGDGSNGHDFAKATSEPLRDGQCLVCHIASDMDGRFEINRDLTRFADASQQTTPYASLSDFCLRCHNRDHQQAGFEISGTASDDPLTAIEDAWLYIDKHGLIDGGGRTYAGLRNSYGYSSRVDCTDCHSMHGTQNAGLIIDRSDKGAIQLPTDFRNTPWPISVRDGDFSQLCVLCHQMATVLDQGAVDTGNGLSGVHQVGVDCRGCHSHGESAQAGM